MDPSSSNATSYNILFTAINCVSVLVCLLAAILVILFKLLNKLVYRLALYQVLASLAFAMVEVFEIIFINYSQSPDVYGQVCTAIGLLSLYTRWVKLLFTMWVAVHLFWFAVLHMNLKKLEALYVATSLLAPVVIAVVPLITHNYGFHPSDNNCFIFKYGQNDSHSIAYIERIALWDGPAMVILITASTAMVVMVIYLAHRVRRRSTYEPITDGDQFWKALKQLLPLTAFPILFLVFEIPNFIYHVRSSDNAPNTTTPSMFAAMLLISQWSMASGITLLLHILVTQRHKYIKNSNHVAYHNSSNCRTVKLESAAGLPVNSNTNFSLPSSSIMGDE